MLSTDERKAKKKQASLHESLEMMKDTMKQTSCIISLFFSSSLDSSLWKNANIQTIGLLLFLDQAEHHIFIKHTYEDWTNIASMFALNMRKLLLMPSQTGQEITTSLLLLIAGADKFNGRNPKILFSTLKFSLKHISSVQLFFIIYLACIESTDS